MELFRYSISYGLLPLPLETSFGQLVMQFFLEFMFLQSKPQLSWLDRSCSPEQVPLSGGLTTTGLGIGFRWLRLLLHKALQHFSWFSWLKGLRSQLNQVSRQDKQVLLIVDLWRALPLTLVPSRLVDALGFSLSK